MFQKAGDILKLGLDTAKNNPTLRALLKEAAPALTGMIASQLPGGAAIAPVLAQIASKKADEVLGEAEAGMIRELLMCLQKAQM